MIAETVESIQWVVSPDTYTHILTGDRKDVVFTATTRKQGAWARQRVIWAVGKTRISRGDKAEQGLQYDNYHLTYGEDGSGVVTSKLVLTNPALRQADIYSVYYRDPASSGRQDTPLLILGLSYQATICFTLIFNKHFMC